jgi:hypothetical protein
MPRDAYPPRPGANLERAGPQPDAIYCPLCAAHLRPIRSRNEEPPHSHAYECEHGHAWEINRFPDGDGARRWNGARPGWETVPDQRAEG